MKKLYSTVIGIDQGTEMLFSDFETGGQMWAGNGEREVRSEITFSEGFKAPPAVQLALELMDMDQSTNQRMILKAEDITKDGFVIVFRTWGDTRMARLRVAWTATGEALGEDDWDVEDVS